MLFEVGDLQKIHHTCNFFSRVFLYTRRSKIASQHVSLSNPEKDYVI